MSLKAQLDICRCSFEANAAPDLVAAMQRLIGQLAETGPVANAVKAGEAAPRFRLRCGRGGFIDLSDLLDRGPVVISFFRGDWCPFCAFELKALAAACADIENLGARLIALSANPPQAERTNCPFRHFMIRDAKLPRAFGSPSPSHRNSGPLTWRSATPTRQKAIRQIGCCDTRHLRDR